MFYLVSFHPEMVDLGSGQDRSPFAPPHRNGIFNTRNWPTLRIAKGQKRRIDTKGAVSRWTLSERYHIQL